MFTRRNSISFGKPPSGDREVTAVINCDQCAAEHPDWPRPYQRSVKLCDLQPKMIDGQLVFLCPNCRQPLVGGEFAKTLADYLKNRGQ